nr:hypothetical protein [Tanacetum cinerariifolium]
MSPKESVGSNDMVHNYYLEEAKKKVQIQKEHALNSKPSVQKTARLPNTANGTKPKPRNSYKQTKNWPPSMSSHVSNRTVNIAKPPRNSKPFLNSKNLACPTCKKCIYTGNHDACIFQYLSEERKAMLRKLSDRSSHDKDSDESGVTYTDISSPFKELLDIGSPSADDHEYLMLPEMLEDPYVEVALQAPTLPDYVPGLEHADDEIVAEDQPYAEDA